MIFKELAPEETELVGMWLDTGLKVMGDAVTDRVEWLTAERLELLAESSGGDRLYRDPRDGRLWERRLPFAGGPPSLLLIDASVAAGKYGIGG